MTVFERGAPGNGQSGGESRIFRHAHDDPRLVDFACRSRAIWRQWDTDLGVELVSPDGVVALGPAVERGCKCSGRWAAADEVISVRSTAPGRVEVRAGGGCARYAGVVV